MAEELTDRRHIRKVAEEPVQVGDGLAHWFRHFLGFTPPGRFEDGHDGEQRVDPLAR